VYAEDFVVHNGSDGEAVEDHVEGLPQLQTVTELAFIVESINAVDRRALVVATQHEKILGVLNLVRKEEADALETLRSAIYIVAQEKVIGLGREASVFEKTQQIGILSVHIPDNLEGGLEFE